MSSIFGRAIIVPKTNKSGGALAKGDVVVADSGNDNAVTTTTSSATTIPVGVVVEENGIANNASGRVQFGGHVSLVNVNASVTRGHFGITHTVAKQATDGGASRLAGAFCVFSTGGTTPEADLFGWPDAAGSSGAATTNTYVTVSAAGDLSAEVPHPELGNYNGGSPTNIDFSAASTDTGVSLLGTANWNAHGKWTTTGAIHYLDVASSIGTGDFDLRARVQYAASGSTIGDSYGGFFVTDGSRTAATMLDFSALPRFAGGAVPTLRGRTGNSNTGSVLNYWPSGRPIIFRIRRTGTTYTYEVSLTEGASWIQIETGTSSLNIGKVGFWFDTNSATACELLIDWVRSY